jgi:hypothetical protein
MRRRNCSRGAAIYPATLPHSRGQFDDGKPGLRCRRPERTRTAAPDRSHFFLVTTGAATTIAVPIRRASQAQRFYMAIEGSADPNIARDSEPSCAKRVRNMYLIGPQGNGCCPNACPFQSPCMSFPVQSAACGAGAAARAVGLVEPPDAADRATPVVRRRSFRPSAKKKRGALAAHSWSLGLAP